MLYCESIQWYRDEKGSDYIASDKGQFRGSCNRSACQAPGLATWFNQSTRAFYCAVCAELINECNPARELKRLGYEQSGLCIPWSNPAHPHRQEEPDWTMDVQFRVDREWSQRDWKYLASFDDRRHIDEAVKMLLETPIGDPPEEREGTKKLIHYLEGVMCPVERPEM